MIKLHKIWLMFISITLIGCIPSAVQSLNPSSDFRTTQTRVDGWDVGTGFDIPEGLSLQYIQLENDPPFAILANRKWGRLDLEGETAPETGDLVIIIASYPIFDLGGIPDFEYVPLDELKEITLGPIEQHRYGYNELAASTKLKKLGQFTKRFCVVCDLIRSTAIGHQTKPIYHVCITAKA